MEKTSEYYPLYLVQHAPINEQNKKSNGGLENAIEIGSKPLDNDLMANTGNLLNDEGLISALANTLNMKKHIQNQGYKTARVHVSEAPIGNSKALESIVARTTQHAMMQAGSFGQHFYDIERHQPLFQNNNSLREGTLELSMALLLLNATEEQIIQCIYDTNEKISKGIYCQKDPAKIPEVDEREVFRLIDKYKTDNDKPHIVNTHLPTVPLTILALAQNVGNGAKELHTPKGTHHELKYNPNSGQIEYLGFLTSSMS